MTRKHTLLALGLALFAGSASVGATTLTNSTGAWSPFGGFDWASNGTAVVSGFDPTATTDTFTITFWASAGSVTQPSGPALIGPSVGILLGDYEYTILATLNETSTCNTFSGGICTDASFQVNSGGFDIYYATTVNANQVTGAGITDGAHLIGGTINAQPGGGFNVISGGNATLTGLVTYTNSLYINPALVGTTAATTLQTVGNTTDWTAPTGMPGSSGTSSTLTGFALQADANQNFSAIPEPTSLALLGLALGALSLTSRRAWRKPA
jgi:hypothetical protein